MLAGDVGGLLEESGLVDGGEAEAGGDEEADEELLVLGADAVGEDAEGGGEERGDDEDLGVRGEGPGPLDGAGGEGGAEGGEAAPRAVPGVFPAGVVGVGGEVLWGG